MTAEIFNHLWQSTAFGAVCALATLALRNNRAQVRYALWLAASVKFLIPFAALSSLGRALGHWLLPPDAGHRFTIVLELVAHPITRTVVPPAPRVPGLGETAGSTIGAVIPSAILATWIVGSLLLIARWVAQSYRLTRVARRAMVMADGREVTILRRLEDRRGVRRRVIVLESDSSMEPGVFGWFRPRLLWPRGISAHLDDSQIEAILAHELSHIGRCDNLIAAVQMSVQAMFWFHPLVWWIGRRLIDERERACDEDVLRQGSEPETYAESILRTCRFAIESPFAGMAGVTGADLKQRIETIVSRRMVYALSATKRALLTTAASTAILAPFVIGFLNAPRTHAQVEGLRIGEQKFEVASVKPNRSGERNGMLRRQPGGRMSATNMPLRQLIMFAYQMTPMTLVGGPSWMNDSRFDIVAKLDGDPPPVPLGSGPDAMMLAMRTLLAERFKLEVHQESRQLDVYALVLARAGGSAGRSLKPSTQDCSPEAIRAMTARAGAGAAPPPPTEIPQCGARMSPGRLLMGGMPLLMLTRPLGEAVGRIVVDRTGLTGNWDADLTFALDQNRATPPGVDSPAPPDPNAPSIFTAVQEQLGLKLESTKAPVDVLAIDQVEPPSPD
jgi:uncharacterized protein (TIGR03435 family)